MRPPPTCGSLRDSSALRVSSISPSAMFLLLLLPTRCASLSAARDVQACAVCEAALLRREHQAFVVCNAHGCSGARTSEKSCCHICCSTLRPAGIPLNLVLQACPRALTLFQTQRACGTVSGQNLPGRPPPDSHAARVLRANCVCRQAQSSSKRPQAIPD